MRNYRRFQRLGFVAAGLALIAAAAGAPVARAAAPSGSQLAATLDGKTSYAATITYQDSLVQTRWSETWVQVGQAFSLKAAQDGKAYSYLGSAGRVCNVGSGAKAICTELEVNTGVAGWTDTYFLSYYGQRPAEVFRVLPVNLRLSLVHGTAGCTSERLQERHGVRLSRFGLHVPVQRHDLDRCQGQPPGRAAGNQDHVPGQREGYVHDASRDSRLERFLAQAAGDA